MRDGLAHRERRVRRRKPGVVLGHEACAEVIDVGPGVRSLHVGQRVVVDPNRPCGTCVPCLDGRTHLALI
jgi:L-iditol 2-dehydrogenase